MKIATYFRIVRNMFRTILVVTAMLAMFLFAGELIPFPERMLGILIYMGIVILYAFIDAKIEYGIQKRLDLSNERLSEAIQRGWKKSIIYWSEMVDDFQALLDVYQLHD